VKMIAAALFLLASSPMFAQADHAGHANPMTAPTAAAAEPRDETLPPSEAQAKAALEKSPRHGEFVDVKMTSGGPVKCWIVYPERKDKAGVVIVIHEIFGLSDWVRGVADQLAREGFIAVVPDLLSGHGPGGGGTEAAGSRDAAVKLIGDVTPAEVVARVNAVRDWAIHLPAANGKSATIGFCWGGTKSFFYAAEQPALNAAVVYYGTSPEKDELALIYAPVLGLYGGDDERVVSTVAPAKEYMKKIGKTFDPHVFQGAGHGFLRAQQERSGANLKATREAWPLTISFLRKYLK
jgi:carboxymethylenebutenolidase